LVSLSDARDCLLKTFASVVRNDALERAIELLFNAAETGRSKDRRAVTDQIEIALRDHGLLS
jgi:hypothetical protein